MSNSTQISNVSTGVSDQNLRDRVFDHVVRQIRGGHYGSGMRLVQRELASQLGISQAPVREALEKLAETGWVERRVGRGMFVKDYSNREDLRQLYEVRRALEVEAVRLVTERATEEQLARLNDVLVELEEADLAEDRDRYRAADVRFHCMIVEFCGNDMLQQMFEPIMQQNNCYKLQSDMMDTMFHLVRPLERMQPRGHRVIVEALAKRNADSAARFMHEHLQTLDPERTAALIQKVQSEKKE